MKKLLAFVAGFTVSAISFAGMLGETVKGTTDYSVELKIIDSTDGTPETGVVFNTAGIDLWYRREGAVSTDITEATLAALTTAHADGGFLAINDGIYRLDLPDAAVATGADYVYVGGTVTGMIVIGGRIKLTDIDMNDGVRGGMTALPNAAADAAGGLPISDAGALDLDALNTNINDIETDTAVIGAAGAGLTAVPYNSAWDAQIESEVTDALVADGLDHLVSAAVIGTDIANNSIIAQLVGDDVTADWDTYDNTTDSLEALRNRGDAAWTTGSGTGLTALASGTAQSGGATTIQLASGESFANDEPNGNTICVNGGTGAGQCRTILDYVSATDTATVAPAWITNPAADSTYEMILGSVNVDAWNGADVSALNDVSTAQVNTEIDTALADIGLDHLISATVTGTDVANNSIIAQMVADDVTADWDTFDNTADSLEALRNRGDAAWTTGSGTGLTALATGTAQSGGATSIQLASGEAFANDEPNGNTICVISGTGAGQCRVVTDYVGGTDTATVAPAWITNPASGSGYEMILGSVNVSVWDGTDVTTALETSADIVAAWASENCAAPAAGSFEEQLCTDVDAVLTDTSTTLDNLVDDLETRLTAARAGYLDNLNGHTAQTGDNFARLGAPVGASISADLQTIEGQTDDIGVAGAGLTEAGGTGDQFTALNDLDAAGVRTAVGLAAANLDTQLSTIDTNVDDLEAATIVASGTCDSGTTSTCVDAVLTQADNDYWQRGVGITFTSGTVDGQSACVYDFVAATDTMTFRPAATQAIATNTYVLTVQPDCAWVVAP